MVEWTLNFMPLKIEKYYFANYFENQEKYLFKFWIKQWVLNIIQHILDFVSKYVWALHELYNKKTKLEFLLYTFCAYWLI